MLPSQTAGVHVEHTLKVLVASQQTQHNDRTLALHWLIGCGAWPAFSQHCHNMSCLVKEIIMLVASNAVNAKHLQSITFIQCWTNVEDAGPTLRECYIIGLCLAYTVCTLLCKDKSQHLRTWNMSRYCPFTAYEAYNIATNQWLQFIRL